MKELDRFTSERLESLCDYRPNRVTNLINFREIAALARIALAAKRAEPNELADAVNEFLAVLDDYPEQLVPINREAALVKDLRKALSSTPQLNSPEIPEGWKLVPIELTAEMAQAAGEAHEGESYLPYSIYRAMLAAAPEKENG
ncbi:TPA: hypothetical protein ACF01X_001534 [Yersinia enterocolitica]